MKTTDGDESKWSYVLHSVLWAERVSIQRSTGYSPYRIAHGVEPMFPFDLAEATYLVPPIDAPMSTDDMLAIRARQFQKRPEDLANIAHRVFKSRQESAKHFLDSNQHSVKNYDFAPGSLVLIRNSAVEMELNRKTKPRFFGPLVVIKRTPRGAYVLSEVDGSVSKTPFAVFRVIPYYACSTSSVPVTRIESAVLPELDPDPDPDDYDPDLFLDSRNSPGMDRTQL